LEKVRKVIKRVGEDLAAMPELADLFLAPLKWQGVVDIDGGAFVIGVKFVSKPGEQFLIRRLAYQRLQAAFAEAGLEFATPKVTVAGGAEVSPAQAVAASRQMQVKER
jgi:small-conductance mechanosensitive channel